MKIAALALLLGGCQSTPDNRVEVTDYRLDGVVARHFEDFEESLYSVSDDGLADIILRKTATHSQDPTQKITQIIHLQTFWKPHPTRTFANDSMINAKISYVMLRGSSGVSYDGGGFVDYRRKKKKSIIYGTIEGGELQPLRAIGSDIAIFDKPILYGDFKATRDDRRVRRIINDIVRTLGPLPRIEPAQTAPDY